MRLAAQVKGGYYPAAPEAIDSLLTRLTIADPTNTAILDPCCGRGKALAQLGAALGVPAGLTYGIELDQSRGREAATSLAAGAHVLVCE